MKKALYSLLIFASAMMFAQKNPNVKFVICNDVVGTMAMFNGQKQNIQNITSYNTKTNLPQNLKKFEFLANANNSLAETKFKKDFGTLDFMSLEDFNLQNGIPAENPVFIDGYQFADTKVNIYAQLIKDMKVSDVNGKKTLMITSVQ